MKKILFAICSATVVFAGCKEYNTAIDFGSNTITQNTYVVSPVPSSDPHQVLVEEFTGQSCPNCPAAHTALDNISFQNPGRINVVSMYAATSPQSAPPGGAKYDFEDNTALSIWTGIYGSPNGLSAAGVDRLSESGIVVYLGTQAPIGIINTQLSVADSVNLLITSGYDLTKNIATITATVTYTQAFSTPQNLSIVVVEDSIYDKQDSTGSSGIPITLDNYLFLDVFRGMVTSIPAGDALQVTAGNNVKEAGRVFQKVYSYALPVKTPAIVPSHCRVIAFVNNTNGADKHVLQSAQCKLSQ